MQLAARLCRFHKAQLATRNLGCIAQLKEPATHIKHLDPGIVFQTFSCLPYGWIGHTYSAHSPAPSLSPHPASPPWFSFGYICEVQQPPVLHLMLIRQTPVSLYMFSENSIFGEPVFFVCHCCVTLACTSVYTHLKHPYTSCILVYCGLLPKL